MNPPPPLSTTTATSCHRHPQEKNFTSFCPSCLFERLSVLDPNASNPSSSSSHRKSSASALKSIFFPELRRSKSFSASKHDASSVTAFEPQRKSCDVRIRTSFYNKEASSEANFENLASEEENEDEIRVVDEANVSEEIVEVEEEEGGGGGEEIEDLKTMKDHIDLDSSQLKKPKSGFWSAATVFSKKLQKWRQKQKEEKESKKPHQRKSVNKPPIGRRFGETQSEVADYGFGRRSCDVDPRFSLDVTGRISFDDPRYSLDEPRPSWEGYLTGRTGNFLKMPPPPTMLSVAEDDAPPVVHSLPPMVNASSVVNVVKTDTQISVEEDDESVIGGSTQTKEYYSDSSRRRKSFDRSNSIRRSEIDELSFKRSNSNSSSIVANGFNVANVAKVNPLNGMKMDLHNGDDYFSAASVIDGDQKEEKKSRRWNIWGFIHWRGSKNKDEDEDRDTRVNGNSGRLFRSNSSVSWRNGGNGNGNKGKDEFVFERNRSARYSAKDVDNNGLLRFYLTPLRGIRRNGSLKASSKSNHTHSFARTVFG